MQNRRVYDVNACVSSIWHVGGDKDTKILFLEEGRGLTNLFDFPQDYWNKGGFLYPLVMINFVIYPKVAVFPYFLMTW